jgi:hypothetical protein
MVTKETMGQDKTRLHREMAVKCAKDEKLLYFWKDHSIQIEGD